MVLLDWLSLLLLPDYCLFPFRLYFLFFVVLVLLPVGCIFVVVVSCVVWLSPLLQVFEGRGRISNLRNFAN